MRFDSDGKPILPHRRVSAEDPLSEEEEDTEEDFSDSEEEEEEEIEEGTGESAGETSKNESETTEEEEREDGGDEDEDAAVSEVSVSSRGTTCRRRACGGSVSRVSVSVEGPTINTPALPVSSVASLAFGIASLLISCSCFAVLLQMK